MRAAVVHRLDDVLGAARTAGRRQLLETEGLALARMLGLAVPHHVLVENAVEARELDLAGFPGDRLVLKACSAEIAHKGAVGGVSIVPADSEALARAVDDMARRLRGHDLAGFLVCEFVPHDLSFGGELLLGMRWTDDFGPVVTLGPGGATAELLAGALKPEHGPAIVSPTLADPASLEAALASGAATSGLPDDAVAILRDVLARALDFAQEHLPRDISEFEINPLIVTPGGPMALDALARLGMTPRPPAPPRPLHKLASLLQPRTMAVVGVSAKGNPGRVIVDNVLAQGFPPERLTIIKPGRETLAGCRCVPSLEALTEPLDLLVVAVSAEQVPDIVEQAASDGRVASIILIPGGLGERPGSEGTAGRVRTLLDASRHRDDRGPVVNGGNCLGVRSVPGRYDTLFIPRNKLAFKTQGATPLAFISQSGAFAVARSSGLWSLDPRYVVTIGNQIDLTAGDYLTHLKDDASLEVFACYLEGFAPQDGRRWLEAAAEITASGRRVVLYRAGRTAEGARATASHTASVAGDWAVTRQLAKAAGVLVAETLSEFEDLVRLACLLSGRRPAGSRLGAVSNAGFECVAVADNLGPFTLADLAPATTAALDALLAANRLQTIVGAANPLDLTPILGDEAFVHAAELVLADEGVDAGIVGCVPHTGALQSLPAGAGHDEDLNRDGSVTRRLVDLFEATDKPWVAVVDAGPRFDPMAHRLEERGVPVFRRMDRALRLLAVWCFG